MVEIARLCQSQWHHSRHQFPTYLNVILLKCYLALKPLESCSFTSCKIVVQTVWTESQHTPVLVGCDRVIRYSGFFGVRSVGPVGPISWMSVYKGL